MRIRTKLMLGFLGIGLLCLSVGPMALSLSKSNIINDGLSLNSDQAQMIKDREIDHHMWLAAFSRFVRNNEKELTIQLDDHKCALGKFL